MSLSETGVTIVLIGVFAIWVASWSDKLAEMFCDSCQEDVEQDER